MNNARKLIEDYKRSANSNELAKVLLNMKQPANEQNLDYHARNKAYSEAFDQAIAEHLGVAITDRETWPDEHGKALAYDWAANLPDA